MLKKLAKLRLLKKYFSLKDALSLYFGLKNNSEEIYLSNLGRKIYLRKNTKDTETFEEIFLSSLYAIDLAFTFLSPKEFKRYTK